MIALSKMKIFKKLTVDLNNTARLLFLVSFIFIIGINLYYSKQPILEQHGFRQTQTAISSFYLAQDGFRLNYATPILGEPWSIPFEFPIYQEIVAISSKFFHLPLTQTGRVWSLVFTVLSCWPLILILKKLKVSPSAVYFVAALFLSTPVYIFWAGSFMIESTALFFAISGLFFYLKIYHQKNFPLCSLMLGSIFLSLALLQKVTTALPVLALAMLLMGLKLLSIANSRERIYGVIKVAIPLGLPLVIAYAWIHYSDFLKSLNILGEYLTSKNLSSWNYGSLQQRVSGDLWVNVIYSRNIKTSSFRYFGLLAIVIALLFIKDRPQKILILTSLILFIAPFLVFTNLHIRHNYYQSANSIYLSVAIGLSVIALLNRFAINKFIASLVLIAFIFSNINFFYRDYYRDKAMLISINNNRSLAVSEYIRENTQPELPIIVFGYDWSSEIPFYSERKALVLQPEKFNLTAIKTPEIFLSGRPSAYIVCPVENFELLNQSIREQYPSSSVKEVAGCNIYVLKI